MGPLEVLHTNKFLPNHNIHLRPTKCPILLPMTSVVVFFFKHQGGFCAQTGCVAPVCGGVRA